MSIHFERKKKLQPVPVHCKCTFRDKLIHVIDWSMATIPIKWYSQKKKITVKSALYIWHGNKVNQRKSLSADEGLYAAFFFTIFGYQNRRPLIFYFTHACKFFSWFVYVDWLRTANSQKEIYSWSAGIIILLIRFVRTLRAKVHIRFKKNCYG